MFGDMDRGYQLGNNWGIGGGGREWGATWEKGMLKKVGSSIPVEKRGEGRGEDIGSSIGDMVTRIPLNKKK